MRRPLAIVALVTLMLAGCSSSGASPEPSPTGAAPTSTTAAPPTVPGPGEPSGGDITPQNCPELMASLSAASNAAGGMTGSGSEGLESVVELMRQLAQNGPSEIRGDFTTLADAYETYVRALEDAGIDLSDPASLANMDPATIAKLEQAGAALDAPAVQQANDNIDAYVSQECS